MGITRQQALDCFASDDLIGIGMEADAVRRSLHPESVVSYTIDLPLEGAVQDSQADANKLHDRMRDALETGATGVTLPQGTSALTLEGYEALLCGIRERFPTLTIQGLSVTGVTDLATAAHCSFRDALSRLRDAGLDSIANEAVLLDEDLRQRFAPSSCSVTDWIDVHRTAHQLGMRTSVTMLFGLGETAAQRVAQMETLRSLQAETGGFTAFTPVPWQPAAGTTPTDVPEPTAVEYLTTLAVSRLFLDNIDNIQGSWPTQGLKVLQMGLRFGSNDAGSVHLDERSGRPGWKPGGATEEELRRIIREAGFKPVQRDALYRTHFLN